MSRNVEAEHHQILWMLELMRMMKNTMNISHTWSNMVAILKQQRYSDIYACGGGGGGGGGGSRGSSSGLAPSSSSPSPAPMSNTGTPGGINL